MNSFMTAPVVGLHIGILASSGTPLQPVFPAKRSHRSTGAEHEITNGLQCTGDTSKTDLVH